MRDFSWSPTEKKIARPAFDRAFARECDAIREEVESRLRRSKDPSVLWSLGDYLLKNREQVDLKYVYRYSQLIGVLAVLIRDGWITEAELAGLGTEKIEAIRTIVSGLKRSI